MSKNYSGRVGMTPEQAVEVFKSSHESKLKYIRVRNDLSQQQLADASGIKKRVIQTYEQGERNIDHAQIDTLCALCMVLNCQITDLLEDEDLIRKFNACK